jgi:hypothetical protein
VTDYTREFSHQEWLTLTGLESRHQPTDLPAESRGVLCCCGRVWLTDLGGQPGEGCRQVRLLRKALRAAQRGAQGRD